MRKPLWVLNALLASALGVMLSFSTMDMGGIAKHGEFLNDLVQSDTSAIVMFVGMSLFYSLLLLGVFRKITKEQGWATNDDLSGGPGRSGTRRLIALELALTALGMLMAYGESAILSGYPDAHLAMSDDILTLVMVAWVLMFLVSRIGIFFFWAPAREIYLGSVLFMLLITPLFGVSVDGPRTYLYDSTVNLLSGFILCFIYLTPVRIAFQRSDSAQTRVDSTLP